MQHRKRLILLFLAMLLFHVAHVLEEIWGRFWIMEAIFGLGWFVLVNWLLFCIPVAIFYFILIGKRPAITLGIIYAAIMVVNGIVHNSATLITGRYFDGFAGGFSGIALMAVGIPLIVALRKGLKHEGPLPYKKRVAP